MATLPRPARVVFVNRFFHPDLSATSQMLSDLAFALASTGLDIHVVASRMRYDVPGEKLAPRERILGVEVHRVATSRLGRLRTAGRLTDYATFYFSMLIAVTSLTRRGDVIVLKTDPPLMSMCVVPIARLRGVRIINWCQDLFPEVAIAAGYARGRLGRLAMWAVRILRDASLRHSGEIVAIGQRMRDRLERHARATGVRVIPNWADTDIISPLRHADNDLRRVWGLSGKFVVAYSGNMGVAHPFGAVLDAAELLQHDDRIRFLFVGGGVRRPWLQAQVRSRGLDGMVRFESYQPRELLRESLAVGDLHLVTLEPSMEGLVLPSKFYGIGAAGRPTLFVGDPRGEIAEEVGLSVCGVAVAPGDGKALAEAIQAYSNSPDRCEREGIAARKLVLERHTVERARDAWLELLEGAAVRRTVLRPNVRADRLHVSETSSSRSSR